MSGTITTKIRKILEQLEEVEREEKQLYKQLEKIENKKKKLQEKLQDYINKINGTKAQQNEKHKRRVIY